MDICNKLDVGLHTDYYTGMRCITTFQSTTDRVYDGGPKRL